MNPYTMWKEQSPRQIFELLKSYKDMNDDSKNDVSEQKNYTVKGKNVKIPEWYTVPEGATVYHADNICREEVS